MPMPNRKKKQYSPLNTETTDAIEIKSPLQYVIKTECSRGEEKLLHYSATIMRNVIFFRIRFQFLFFDVF